VRATPNNSGDSHACTSPALGRDAGALATVAVVAAGLHQVVIQGVERVGRAQPSSRP
jgi:hypothetical protein